MLRVAVLVRCKACSYAGPAVEGRIANLGVLVHRAPRTTRLVALACVLAAVALECVIIASPSAASVRPTVAALSRHRGPYWGATLVAVRGSNLGDVEKVMFGSETGYALHVVSPTKLV